MKHVAILGCSHSAIRTCDKVWTKILADKNPNLQIDNFAKSGHGHLYMDMVLKHIMYESETKYDWIIVQLSGNSRWHQPIMGEKLENPFRIEEDTTHGNFRTWVLDTVRENTRPYTKFEQLNTDEVSFRGSSGPLHIEKFKQRWKNEHFSDAEYFSQLFKKQINDMALQGVPISYFSFWHEHAHATDNIGLKTSAKVKLLEQAGSEIEFAKNYMQDDGHLNEYGNEKLYEILAELPLFNQHLS